MKNRGFTLIEMLVSVAIFTIVMVVALGALLSLSEADRKAQTINAAVNNLSFAVDSMSRLIRTGLDYDCGASDNTVTPIQRDCINTPMSSIAFQVVDNSLNGCVLNSACSVVYKLDVSQDPNISLCGQKILPYGCIERKICANNFCGAFAPITSPEVTVLSLSFYVIGETSGDNVQPKVTILVSGTAPVTATKSTAFNLQTSVTARLYGL